MQKINYFSCDIEYPKFKDFLPNGIYYNEHFNFENEIDLPKLMIKNVFKYRFFNYFINEPFVIAKFNMYNDKKKLKRWILENIFNFKIDNIDHTFVFRGYNVLYVYNPDGGSQCLGVRLIKHYFGGTYV